MRSTSRNHTIALAIAGAIVVSVLVVSSVLADFSRPTAWIAIGTIATAALLVAVRSLIPACLLSLSALALITSGLASYTDGTAIARGIAILAPPIALAFAGVSITPRRRPALVLVIAGAVIAGPVRALFFDPFLDAECVGCRHSAFAVFGDIATATVLAVAGGGLLVVGLALLVPISAYPVSAFAVAASALIAIPEVPVGPEIGAAAGVVVAAGTGVVLAGSKLRRRARLGALERAPRSSAALLDALRRAFHDPSLEVRYAASDAGWVDSVGTPVGDTPSGRARTPVAARIALEHDPTAPIAGVLDDGLPQQLLVSLEEQRLTAELAAQLKDLSDSRVRVVRRADDERRRLERDLHDGAQQHLLALGFDLRRALGTAHPDTRVAFERCLAITMRALDSMREIAHGIYPPLLALSGLQPALRALPAVVDTNVSLEQPVPSSVERLAYLVVEDFARTTDAHIKVRGTTLGDRLVLDIAGTTSSPSALVLERVGALDGTLTGSTPTWHLEVPCA